MNRERLTHLVTILKRLEPAQLEMSNWFYDLKDRNPACGTAACACGQAALDPAFNAQGFSHFEGEPSFEGLAGWAAVRYFFDLSQPEAESMFDPASYSTGSFEPITPAEVIERIEEFLS